MSAVNFLVPILFKFFLLKTAKKISFVAYPASKQICLPRTIAAGGVFQSEGPFTMRALSPAFLSTEGLLFSFFLLLDFLTNEMVSVCLLT